MEWSLLQCGPSLDCPLVALGINVFGIDASLGVNQTSFYALKAVRLLTDKFELVDPDASPSQKSDCLFFAGISDCIGAL